MAGRVGGQRMNEPISNAQWAGRLVDTLVAAGVDTFCIAPGSRSTPLVVAVASRPALRTFVHIDERGLGFFALGVAKGGGRPVAVIATSGTAVANVVPAVVEASYDGVPLVVLSADRPPHLTDSGANQTIRQPGLFSHFVRAELALPLPSDATWATLSDQVGVCLAKTQGIRPGPAHINCPFEDPLYEPASVPSDVTFPPAPSTQFASLPHWELDASRAVLAIGQLERATDQLAAETLARELGWPVIADITSGVRHAGIPALISYYDLLLGIKNAWKTPTAILHVGGRLTSKAYLDWITALRPAVFHVPTWDTTWDPAGLFPTRCVGPLSAFREPLLALGPCDPSWTAGWLADNAAVADQVEKIASGKTWSLVHLAQALGRLPSRLQLFAGNSSAIRLLDRYTIFDGPRRVWANRGASGIDGTLATAMGVAQGTEAPLLMLVGDLAALHDMNSLLMAKDLKWPVVFVVLNNRGGGIFQSLPVREFDQFERYFKTPHAVSFQKMADLFALNYALADGAKAFHAALAQCRQATRSTIIEVPLG
jgi:2-succinyl-5-enolpyruvyl-6-hydroxy-3-cyclohexene-1-carboxylate synthase